MATEHPQQPSVVHPCEYGHPKECGVESTWTLYSDHHPYPMFGCDRHAPLMAQADQAHRLPSAPPMELEYLKAYVTALAWQAYLLRTTSGNQLRAENAGYAFRNARDEYNKRLKETAA